MTAPEVAALLKGWDNILILTHKRPDGDTLGCALALRAMLTRLGKTVWLLPSLDATALFTSYLEGSFAPEGFTPDYVVSVDVASLNLLPDNALPYRERIDLSIDHHPSNDGFGKENWVESDKAACGEILYQLALELGGLTPEIALPLYLAVSTDTGCFLYTNTTANTHTVAAALMATGIDVGPVNKRHFRAKSYHRLRLESHLIETMDRYDEGQTVLVSLSLADKARLELTPTDLEDIAAVAGQLEGVRTAVTIQELKPGECKLSVRTGPELNATRVCALLGGGGHATAAGCTVMGSVEEAKGAILSAIRQVQQDG